MPFPTFSFLYNYSVRKLLGWKQGGEEEKWAEKAIESLSKKLKKKKGAIANLEFALANPGCQSLCVTIEKSLDGRLQVSHRKGLPHFIYCKVFRWPDLCSHHELRPVECCKYPYNSKHQKEVCINPYHYRRVEYSSRYADCDTASLTSGIDQRLMIEHHSMTNVLAGQLAMNSNGNPSPTLSLSPNRDFGYISSDCSSPEAFHEFSSHDCMMELNYVAPQPQRPLFSDREYWCSVSNYELNSRVGEIRKFRSPSFIVDGSSDASCHDDRICLGLYTSINRNSTVTNTRRGIGLGFRVTKGDYLEKGEYHGKKAILIDCLSANPIFVQSRCFNYGAGRDLATVCKIVPDGGSVPVFLYEEFRKCIEETRMYGYEALHDLHKMCTVRVSFSKGWGEQYRRQDITSTPCWIEITFFEPLKLLDNEVANAEIPVNAISSRS